MGSHARRLTVSVAMARLKCAALALGRHSVNRLQRKPGKCSWTYRISRSQLSYCVDPKNVPGSIWGSTATATTSVTLDDIAKSRRLSFQRSFPNSRSNLKMREFRQHIEGNRLSWQAFCDQIDPIMRAVPEKMRCAIEMPHTHGDSRPIKRAQVKSAATGSSARTIFPRCR